MKIEHAVKNGTYHLDCTAEELQVELRYIREDSGERVTLKKPDLLDLKARAGLSHPAQSSPADRSLMQKFVEQVEVLLVVCKVLESLRDEGFYWAREANYVASNRNEDALKKLKKMERAFQEDLKDWRLELAKARGRYPVLTFVYSKQFWLLADFLTEPLQRHLFGGGFTLFGSVPFFQMGCSFLSSFVAFSWRMLRRLRPRREATVGNQEFEMALSILSFIQAKFRGPLARSEVGRKRQQGSKTVWDFLGFLWLGWTSQFASQFVFLREDTKWVPGQSIDCTAACKCHQVSSWSTDASGAGATVRVVPCLGGKFGTGAGVSEAEEGWTRCEAFWMLVPRIQPLRSLLYVAGLTKKRIATTRCSQTPFRVTSKRSYLMRFGRTIGINLHLSWPSVQLGKQKTNLVRPLWGDDESCWVQSRHSSKDAGELWSNRDWFMRPRRCPSVGACPGEGWHAENGAVLLRRRI